jgi:hypothetical protein
MRDSLPQNSSKGRDVCTLVLSEEGLDENIVALASGDLGTASSGYQGDESCELAEPRL